MDGEIDEELDKIVCLFVVLFVLLPCLYCFKKICCYCAFNRVSDFPLIRAYDDCELLIVLLTVLLVCASTFIIIYASDCDCALFCL